jgi:DNA repair protein RadC
MTYEIVSIRKRKTVCIKCPDDTYKAVKQYAKNKQEHFLVITLNSTHNIIGIHIATIGLINRTIIHPREVFIHAIRDNAACIIVCHNHPSGSTEPSPEDIEITNILMEASKILGIHFLDHVIIGKDGYYSFKQNNTM